MNLCQLSTVKVRLGLEEADVKDDAILENAIAAVGGRFEQECNRQFARLEDATFLFRANDLDLVVDRFPIESVSEFALKENETTGFVVEEDVEFVIGPALSIIELYAPLGTAREIGRVTFTGGYVLPGGVVAAGQVALPAELEQAAVEQCVYWYQNRDRLGLVSVSGEGGSVSQFASLNMLPSVLPVLRKFERWRP